MSTTTDFLGLFKYDTTKDAKEVFSIDKSLNNNWDAIDSKMLLFNNYIEALRSPNAQYITGDKSTITIIAGTILTINDYEYTWNEDTSYIVTEILDSGDSLSAGTDYCIYLIEDGSIIVSANSTYPTGYSTTTSKKIGGFHTLCVTVTESTAPTLAANSFWDTHPAIGYDAGDIIPNSVWTNRHRPYCDPSGMVYISGYYGERPFWVDIYLQSGTYESTASQYGATVTNSRQQILHQYDMTCVGKKLATDNQFSIFAEGSNNCTSIYGSALPSSPTSGGHVDTSSIRMISGFFVEECCGYLWQWLDEISPSGGSSWSNYSVTTRGATYGYPYVLRAGGLYDDSTHCGPWSRNSNDTRSSVLANTGGRGVSFPLTFLVTR